MSQKTLAYHNLPSSLQVMSRVLLKKSTKQDIPALQVNIRGFKFDSPNLQAYKEYCGFLHSEVPLTYLFVATQKAQLLLLTDPQFPLKTLGLIHTGIHFERHKPIDVSANYDIEIKVGSVVSKPRGIEFELQVQLFNNGDLICGFNSRYFSITTHSRKGNKAPLEEIASEFKEREVLAFSEKQVRGYARVSRDYNPIHLHRFTSAPFGFKKPIAHGLYLLARSVVSLDIEPSSIDVEFKRPALLPIKTHLHSAGNQALLLNPEHKPLLKVTWAD